jgi:hypothetical protein
MPSVVAQELGAVGSRCFLAANHIFAGIPMIYLIERVTKSSIFATSFPMCRVTAAK